VKGFNLIFDLQERPFFIRVAAHLGATGRNYSTSGNYILHLGMVGGGILVLKLLHKPRDHTKIEAWERILVTRFQDV
jgi:hypothetical protein